MFSLMWLFEEMSAEEQYAAADIVHTLMHNGSMKEKDIIDLLDYPKKVIKNALYYLLAQSLLKVVLYDPERVGPLLMGYDISPKVVDEMQQAEVKGILDSELLKKGYWATRSIEDVLKRDE